jgi:tetratricopeptide (TPR) repeat protein
MIGKSISHYKVLEKLGEGGMGVVYRAEDTRLKRQVALKFLPPDLTRDAPAKERLTREAQAASSLQHNNICTVHDVDETIDGRMFIVMDCYDGTTVRQMVDDGPLPVDEAVRIGIQVGRGLAEAHRHDIVHRDVKSGNILNTGTGDIKVLDFGIAALAGEVHVTTTSGIEFGTAAYMSPEQLKGGPIDHRSDIWSLGVVLYEMLTGSLPFSSKFQPGLVYAILHEEPVPVTTANTAVPDDVVAVVEKALRKNVDERYQRMSELVADLEGAIRVAGTAGLRELFRRGLNSKRARRTVAAIGFGMVALAALAIWRFLAPVGSPSPPSSIAVIGCENQTGDTTYNRLERIVPNLLITKLQTLPGLEVTTWSRLLDLARQAGADDVGMVERDLGFELCRMDGVEAIAIPTVSKLGGILVTHVEVVDVESKTHIASASAQGEGDESILDHQVDDLGSQIAEAMSLHINELSASAGSIADVTTTSIEAYELYLRGKEARLRFDFNRARVLLEKAVRLDTTFAYAYFELSGTFQALMLGRLAIEAMRAAHRFSHKATDLERRYIEAEYVLWRGGHIEICEGIIRDYPKEKDAFLILAAGCEGTDTEKAIEYLKKALALDPDYPEALSSLGYAFMRVGAFDRARECFERYGSVVPDNPNVFDCMGELYFRIGDLDGAVAEYKKTTTLDPNFFYSWTGLAYISALREDYTTALGYIERMIAYAPSPAIAAAGYRLRSFFHHWLGRGKEALEDLRTAENLHFDAGGVWYTTRDRILRAMILHDLGRFARSRSEFNAPGTLSLKSQVCPDYSFGITSVGKGLSDLVEGDLRSARMKLGTIDSVLDKPTCRKAHLSFVRNAYLAEVLLREGRIEDCIAHCDTVEVPPLFLMSFGEVFLYNFPFLVDQRARALEQSGNVGEAVVEYKRLLAFDPESNNRRLVHPLYHYRLAKLNERQGMISEARAEYQAFLRLWDKADPERPQPEDARERLADLSVSHD